MVKRYWDAGKEVIKFLNSLRNLVKSKGIKTPEQAYEFAKNQFGEVSKLLKKQIDDIFKKKDVVKPTKKGEVVPIKKKEGIMATEEASPLMKGIEDTIEMLQNNPKRPGGPLDPATGLTRTAARLILQKLSKEGKINIPDEREREAIVKGFQGGVDPIEVFRKTFGQDVLGDVANLSDELLEIERRGGSYKELNKVLEDAGFFNLKQTKNPPQGMKDTELLEIIKKTEPNTQVFKDSEGGIKGIIMGGDDKFKKAMSEAMEEGMRESENMKRLGLDPTKMDDALKYDEMKKAGQLEKNVTGSADLSPVEDLKREFPGITDEMIENILTDTDPQRIAEVKQTMREAMEMEKKGMSVEDIINAFKNQTRTKQATGGRVLAASGGLIDVLKL